MPPVRNMLFVRTDRLGETLLNLPAIAALKSAMPGARLWVLVHPDLAALMESAPGVDRVLTYRPQYGRPWWLSGLNLARRLRRHRFDVAVVSNPTRELHLAVWLAGIKRRAGYGRKWGWCLTDRLADRKSLGEHHEVEYNLGLVQALGLPVSSSPDWRFPRFERETAEVLRLLEQQKIRPSDPLIAIHPWASNPIKCWPADRYQALIRRVVERLSVRVVLVGTAEEADRAQVLIPPGVGVANLVGRLSLRQLGAVLQRAGLLVSNDSGPVHLASAVSARVVALFGTTVWAAGPRRWGPWGEGHAVVWKPSMEAISVEEVFEAVQSRLHPDSQPTHPSS